MGQFNRHHGTRVVPIQVKRIHTQGRQYLHTDPCPMNHILHFCVHRIGFTMAWQVKRQDSMVLTHSTHHAVQKRGRSGRMMQQHQGGVLLDVAHAAHQHLRALNVNVLRCCAPRYV